MLAVGTAATEPWCQVAFSAVDHHPQFLKVQGWFLKAWPQLVQETWLPMYRHLHDLPQLDHDVRLSDDRLIYLARLLETALWWAIDVDAEPNRLDRVHDAARALANADAKIGQAAAALEARLRERSALIVEGLVRSEWFLPGAVGYVSNLNLWGLLEEVVRQPEFSNWAYVCRDTRRKFLVEATTQRRRSPGMADLVGLLVHGKPSDPEACHIADGALLSKGRGRSRDQWTNLRSAFFAEILQAWGRRVSDWDAIRTVLCVVRPGKHDLGGQALATLLTVASGFAESQKPPSAFGAEAMRKAAFDFDPVVVEARASLSMPGW